MTFPDFDKWCDEILHPQDTHPWNFRTREFYEEYRTKYAIAKMIQPRTILEVGVRFGYGAYSFLEGADTFATYCGLDADEPSWGPYPGIPREWAEAQLKKRFPRCLINTRKFDTQSDETGRLGLSFADLIHIDGDHSYEGALHDMETFWPLCHNVMVVDDTNEIADVRNAVKTFCAQHADAIPLPVTSYRGSMLLVRA
jgi:predicted O-methyltransferase YrrM